MGTRANRILARQILEHRTDLYLLEPFFESYGINFLGRYALIKEADSLKLQEEHPSFNIRRNIFAIVPEIGTQQSLDNFLSQVPPFYENWEKRRNEQILSGANDRKEGKTRKRKSRKGFYGDILTTEVTREPTPEMREWVLDEKKRRFFLEHYIPTVPQNLSPEDRNITGNFLRAVRHVLWKEGRLTLLSDPDVRLLFELPHRIVDYGVRTVAEILLLQFRNFDAKSNLIQKHPTQFTVAARPTAAGMNTIPDTPPVVLEPDHPNNRETVVSSDLAWIYITDVPRIMLSTIAHRLYAFSAGPAAVDIFRAMLKVLDINKDANPDNSVEVRLAYYAMATLCACMREALKQEDRSKIADMNTQLLDAHNKANIFYALLFLQPHCNLNYIIHDVLLYSHALLRT